MTEQWVIAARVSDEGQTAGTSIEHVQLDECRESVLKDGGAVAVAVAAAPPRVRLVATTEMEHYTAKQKTVAIRHSSDDRVVAMVEIVSKWNKNNRKRLSQFLEKAKPYCNEASICWLSIFIHRTSSIHKASIGCPTHMSGRCLRK